jgi:hypothetical protein
MAQSRSISRRAFVQAGSSAAAAGLLGVHVVDLEAQMPALDTANPVRFGIVGVGTQGSNLLSNSVALAGAKCVAASDLYDGRHTLAREIAGPDIKTTRRYREILDDKMISRSNASSSPYRISGIRPW